MAKNLKNRYRPPSIIALEKYLIYIKTTHMYLINNTYTSFWPLAQTPGCGPNKLGKTWYK